MARLLLVSYPGYPSTPATLVANPWLANSLGVLNAQGHKVLALDYGTLSMMRRLYPEALTERLKPMVARLAGSGGAGEEQLALLRQTSDELEQHQAQIETELVAEIVKLAQTWQPDIVAIELGDTGGYEANSLLLTTLRHALPEVRLVLGGRKAIWFRDLLLQQHPALDGVIVGDVEAVLPALTERNGGLIPIPGLLEREVPAPKRQSEHTLDLDTLPAPLFDPEVYPAMAGDEKIKMPIVTDSRGCSNRCAFCVHPYEDGARIRRVSAQRVVDHFAALQTRYGFSVFRLTGASTPTDLLQDIAQEILNRGLRVRYNTFGHFRTATAAHFPLLAESGLSSIFYGLETGSQTILDRACHKGIKLDQASRTVKAAQQAGIFAATSMIVPLPFDTPETLAESLEFVVAMHPDAVPLQFPGVMPGSLWYEQPERYGIVLADRQQFLINGLRYRFKLLFPPQFWEPLPFTINGQSFHEFTAITTQFGRALDTAGILTNFSHTLASLAEAAEMPPRQLRDLAQLWCLTGDAEAMSDMVRRANQNMLQP